MNKKIVSTIKSKGLIVLAFNISINTFNDIIFNSVEEFEKFNNLSKEDKKQYIYDNGIVDRENEEADIDFSICDDKFGLGTYNIIDDIQ